MKQYHKIGQIFALFVAGITAIAIALIPFESAKTEAPAYTVVIDPGHGGQDGGATARDGSSEKEKNLAYALTLKEELEQRGITVILTRSTDTDTDGTDGFHKKADLAERARIGNESGADLFVSIHMNASESDKDKGFQVWYGIGNASGKDLADRITDRVDAAGIATRIRAVKQVPETLYVFRTVKIPSVLIECGFLTNAADLYKIGQDSYRIGLCRAIADGIEDYLTSISSRIT